MIPGNQDSWGETRVSHSHSLVPQRLLYAFFFLYALERQISKSKEDQKHMPMPAGPASPLMVIQPQLFFQLLVSLLNPETLMKEANHLEGRHVLGHIAEEVAKFGLVVIFLSSLDDPRRS